MNLSINVSSCIVLSSNVVKTVQAWPCANILDDLGISEALGKTTHDSRVEGAHPHQGIFFSWFQHSLGGEQCQESSS